MKLYHNGEATGIRVTRAGSFWQRAIGLLGRAGLAADAGLWIQPCGRVHTWGMRFAIDVVVCRSDGKVVALATDLAPWRLGPPAVGRGVALELRAGAAARLGISVGDQLTLGRG
jgi:uncharacterized membrane protein (UPF0127 family)